MAEDLIVYGDLSGRPTLNPPSGAYASFTADVQSIVHKSTRDTTEIPPTMAADGSSAAGAESHELEVKYAVDPTASALYGVLFTAALSANKSVDLKWRYHEGAADPDDNPEYTATGISSGVEGSGEAGGQLTGTVTFSLTDRPVVTP